MRIGSLKCKESGSRSLGGFDDRPPKKPLKQSDDGLKLYARISGPKGHIFCYLLCVTGSGLEVKLSNNEARRLGLEDAEEVQNLPQPGDAGPMSLSRRLVWRRGAFSNLLHVYVKDCQCNELHRMRDCAHVLVSALPCSTAGYG